MWARCGGCKKIGGKYLAIRNWQQTARKNWNYALTKHGTDYYIEEFDKQILIASSP